MEEIIKIAQLAQNQDFVTAKGCYISVRDNQGMIITDNDADFANLRPCDLITVSRTFNINKEFATHMAIYQALPSVKVIVHLKPQYCNIASILNITPRVSLEMFAEAIGKKLNVTTSIPERVVETLLKDRECLILNSGLLVVGQTLEATYNRAKIIEQAVFSYIAIKAVAKRASARSLPCDKLYDKCATQGYDFADNVSAVRTCLNKLKDALIKIDEENTCIIADMPIFIGLFAGSTMNINGITTIEYGDFDNKKYLRNLAETVNREGVVLMRGRGLLVVDDDDNHARETLDKIENACREQIIALVQQGLDDYTAELGSIAKLLIKRLDLKAAPVL